MIYVGTFSKLLWPRLRLGWVAASPELTERLAYLRQTTEMGGQQIAQQAIATLQKDGTLDRYTRRAHREYRRRMIGLLRACRLHLGPQDVKFRVPTGGFTVWAESSLPSVLETTLVARLQQAGVLVQAGLPCHVAPPSAWLASSAQRTATASAFITARTWRAMPCVSSSMVLASARKALTSYSAARLCPVLGLDPRGVLASTRAPSPPYRDCRVAAMRLNGPTLAEFFLGLHLDPGRRSRLLPRRPWRRWPAE
ncbi:aminotransferase class I/II-fold pyridoxal phosphate-dependent enzyme [Candidatus Skiveiella danica]|uniref:aminotransferase class I/II-fold pyridoxal phosphate-dependent enzyme n=1 Tax=Candidatus Skiveiella danica TaxID=3386177 RepID=UPI0039B8759E